MDFSCFPTLQAYAFQYSYFRRALTFILQYEGTECLQRQLHFGHLHITQVHTVYTSSSEYQKYEMLSLRMAKWNFPKHIYFFTWNNI